MSQTSTEHFEADDELLTSYLDQELAVQERASLELRLVHDEKLRNRLAELRRAWDLLDELPETPFTPNFTQTTLEMVAVDLEKERENTAPVLGIAMPKWVQRFSRATRLACVVGAMAAVGLLIGLMMRNRYRTLESRNIAIAARLSVLKEFPDLEVLKPIAELPNWKSLLDMDSVRNRILLKQPEGNSPAQVEKYVNALDAHQKELLWDRLQALEREPVDERIELERRYKQAVEAGSSDQELNLLATAVVGYMQRMSSNERAEIQRLPFDEKMVRLRQEIADTIANSTEVPSSPAEGRRIQEWKVNEMIPKILELIPPSQDRNDDQDSMIWRLRSFDSVYEIALEARVSLLDSFCEVIDEDHATLLRAVSPRDQLQLMISWVTDTRLRTGGRMTEEELAAIYNRLDEQHQNEVELMSSSDARRELYYRNSRGRGRSGPPFAPGGGPPNGPIPGLRPGIGGPDGPPDFGLRGFPPFIPQGGRLGPGQGGPDNRTPPDGRPFRSEKGSPQ